MVAIAADFVGGGVHRLPGWDQPIEMPRIVVA
jgi:hypothetical protein